MAVNHCNDDLQSAISFLCLCCFSLLSLFLTPKIPFRNKILKPEFVNIYINNKNNKKVTTLNNKSHTYCHLQLSVTIYFFFGGGSVTH